MTRDVVLRVEGLGKRYRLGARQRYRTLREVWSEGMATLARRGVPSRRPATGERSAAPEDEWIWALREVAFEVARGAVVGLIGRNGSGKSTLLKIVSRITKPTEGHAEIHGRIGSLLEVGTGFHPELTGRENVYLNGAILGMGKAEIDRKFDEIVAFAETERFLDTPVKRYSSGMYLRLAFAVAAHLEPEILIVDEVLAVGDAAFQKKCLGKMGDVARQGRTILFVSHNLAAVTALCSTALVLDQGRIVARGDPGHCVEVYTAQFAGARASHWVRSGPSPARGLVLTSVATRLRGAQPQLTLDVDVRLESRSSHKPAFLAVDILDAGGTPIMQALPQPTGFIEPARGEHDVKVAIELPPLIPGQYLVTVWVGTHHTETLDEVREAVMFEIHDSPTPGRTYPHTRDHGWIVPPSSVST